MRASQADSGFGERARLAVDFDGAAVMLRHRSAGSASASGFVHRRSPVIQPD
jgi:hypothetical protein